MSSYSIPHGSHVIPAAQLVQQYKSIGRCNNYAVLQSIPCFPECKIVGQILLDHPLSYARTATADVPAVYLQQFWRTLSKKKEAIQYPHFIKLIIADLMKKFPNIPKRLEEDYHSIKDDVPLVSVYTTRNVLVRGMLIPDAFLTTEIWETNDFKEYETVFMNVDKDDVDSEDRLESGSHKENPKVFDDDDDNAREKKDDTMGNLEIRNEETQTTISTPIRSPRKSLSSDKQIFQELTDTMCRRQGYMIQDMERKCVTTEKFWETHNKVDQVLKEVTLEIAEYAVNDLIEYNLKPCIAETIIEDRDAFRSDIPAFVSQEFKTHAPKIIIKLFKEYVQPTVIHVHPTTISSAILNSSADLQYQLYLKMKSSLQDRADNITLEDDFHSYHDEHQDDDAPLEGEKRVKMSKKSKRSKSVRGSSSKNSRKDSTTYVSKQQSQHQEWNAWKEENVVNEDEVIPKDVTPELITEF
ncbi:hypothetical protein Tco_1503699 [Tanacetum coccineum]